MPPVMAGELDLSTWSVVAVGPDRESAAICDVPGDRSDCLVPDYQFLLVAHLGALAREELPSGHKTRWTGDQRYRTQIMNNDVLWLSSIVFLPTLGRIGHCLPTA